jgi:hypothetical protein
VAAPGAAARTPVGSCQATPPFQSTGTAAPWGSSAKVSPSAGAVTAARLAGASVSASTQSRRAPPWTIAAARVRVQARVIVQGRTG